MENKELLKLLFDAASAGSGGALDEASYGVYDKVMPESQRKAMEEHPYIAGAGRAASYLNPMAPEMLLGKFAAKGGMSFLKHILAKEAPALVKGLVEGGISGGTSAATQSGARKMFGDNTARPEEAGTSGAIFGSLFGGAGSALKSVAKDIYSHPAFLSGNTKSDEGIINRLMDSGFMGSLKGAKKFAQGEQDNFRRAADEIVSSASQREATATGALQDSADQEFDRQTKLGLGYGKPEKHTFIGGTPAEVNVAHPAGATESERLAINDLNSTTKARLTAGGEGRGAGQTSLNRVSNELKDVNTQLLPYGKAFNPDYATTNKVSRLQDLKGVLEELEAQGIDKFGHPGDAGELNVARKTVYRPAKDLEKNITKAEYGQGGLGAPSASSPQGWLSRLGSDVVNSTVGSAPVRTGVGMAASKVNPAYIGGVIGNQRESADRSTEDKKIKELYSKYINFDEE